MVMVGGLGCTVCDGKVVGSKPRFGRVTSLSGPSAVPLTRNRSRDRCTMFLKKPTLPLVKVSVRFRVSLLIKIRPPYLRVSSCLGSAPWAALFQVVVVGGGYVVYIHAHVARIMHLLTC